jgi:hypothetical protein
MYKSWGNTTPKARMIGRLKEKPTKALIIRKELTRPNERPLLRNLYGGY